MMFKIYRKCVASQFGNDYVSFWLSDSKTQFNSFFFKRVTTEQKHVHWNTHYKITNAWMREERWNSKEYLYWAFRSVYRFKSHKTNCIIATNICVWNWNMANYARKKKWTHVHRHLTKSIRSTRESFVRFCVCHSKYWNSKCKMPNDDLCSIDWVTVLLWAFLSICWPLHDFFDWTFFLYECLLNALKLHYTNFKVLKHFACGKSVNFKKLWVNLMCFQI